MGFGRLVRSTGDRAAVLVLDGRIAKKSYERYFLESPAPAAVVRGPWRVVKEALLEFYRERVEARRAE